MKTMKGPSGTKITDPDIEDGFGQILSRSTRPRFEDNVMRSSGSSRALRDPTGSVRHTSESPPPPFSEAAADPSGVLPTFKYQEQSSLKASVPGTNQSRPNIAVQVGAEGEGGKSGPLPGDKKCSSPQLLPTFKDQVQSWCGREKMPGAYRRHGHSNRDLQDGGELENTGTKLPAVSPKALCSSPPSPEDLTKNNEEPHNSPPQLPTFKDQVHSQYKVNVPGAHQHHPCLDEDVEDGRKGGGISAVKDAIKGCAKARKGKQAASAVTKVEDIYDILAVKGAILSRSRNRRSNLDADASLAAEAAIRACSRTRDGEELQGVTEDNDADDISAVKEAIISRSRNRTGARAMAREVDSDLIGVEDQKRSAASPAEGPVMLHASPNRDNACFPFDESIPRIASSTAASAGSADPSLINAVLVESGLVVKAEPIAAENYCRRWIILALIVTLALIVGLAAGICGDGSCGPAPPPSPATPAPSSSTSSEPTPSTTSPPSSSEPTPSETLPSCFLDFSSTRCYIGGNSTDAGLRCEEFILPIPELQTCAHPPIEAGILFNGGNCSQSDNIQDLNFTCNDFNGGPPINLGDKAYIKVTDHNYASGQEEILFEGNATVGDFYTIATSNSTIFGDKQRIVISSVSDHNVILQIVNLSLTCVNSLELANRYGANQVVSFYNTEQGSISLFATFTFSYAVSIQLTIITTRVDESILITNLTADTSFAGLIDLTSLVPDVIDTFNPGSITLSGYVDTSTRKVYSLVYHYEGYSNATGSPCRGKQSAAFAFGAQY